MLAITARLCPSHPAAIHSPMYSLLTSHQLIHFLSRLPQTRTATKSYDLAKISHVTVHNNNDQSGRQPHITQSSHQENPIGFSSFLSHRPTPCSHLSSGRPALALAGHPTAPASAASKPGSSPPAGARSHGGPRLASVVPPCPSPPLPAPPY